MKMTVFHTVKFLAWLCITLALIQNAELRPQKKSVPNIGAKCGYAVGQQKLSLKM